MSLTDPGPRNPLFFFSLALLGKVPNFIPNDLESLNQLECIEEALHNIPDNAALIGSLGNVIAVTCDALLFLCASESKKSLQIRSKSALCLHQLLRQVSVNFAALLEIFPGVLSKMVKVATGRVDTEDDTILLTCVQIIETLTRTFWEKQHEWTAEVVEKEKFRANVDFAISALKPLVYAESRRNNTAIQATLSSIFTFHLLDGYKQKSRVSQVALQHAALNQVTLSSRFKDIAFAEYSLLMDWFDSAASFDEEVNGKLLCLIGIVSVEGAQKIVSVPQIFSLCLFRLFELSENKIGNVVDVEYSTNLIGTENVFMASSESITFQTPKISFKRKQKHPNKELSIRLFSSIVNLDSNSLANEILNVSDPLLQMDLIAQFLNCKFDSDLFSVAMKRLRLVPTLPIEEGQLLQLAALKVLWARFVFPASKSELQQHLPFVLLCSASQWIILRESSTELLRFLAFSDSSSLSDFISKHCQFLLDRLAIQLGQPGLFPEAPNIIAVLLNHLVDEEIVVKFTDLLVGKVGENLTLYRTFPAYCHGLLQVAQETLKKATNPSCALDLMRIAQYFIVSDSKTVRISALKALQNGVELFPAEDSSLCQLIHSAWPGCVACLNSLTSFKSFEVTQLDFNLADALLNFLRLAARKCPVFMRDRLVKDFWRGCLKKHQFSSKSKIDPLLISGLADCLESCLFGTEVVLEVLEKFRAGEGAEVFKLFEAIFRVEPDPLWHFFVFELGGLKGAELKAPEPHLITYETPSNCSNQNVNLRHHLSTLLL